MVYLGTKRSLLELVEARSERGHEIVLYAGTRHPLPNDSATLHCRSCRARPIISTRRLWSLAVDAWRANHGRGTLLVDPGGGCSRESLSPT
jgi:hypothetical protein